MARILVGMSGGVDSSTTALLLQQQGHQVHGVTMKIWRGAPAAHGQRKHACYGPGEEADIEDAARVAAHLGIPFSVIDLAERYEEIVLSYFKEEYLRGRTPNPCVFCNRDVKFGFLVDKAAELGIPFDFFATGHYVRKAVHAASGREVLMQATEAKKDQSYFLALLTQEQIRRTLFPLGGMAKPDVRDIARKHGLPVSDKPDSQDFIELESYADIFGTEITPGPIFDESGTLLGEHEGIYHYTIGQRKGLKIAVGEPRYVVGIDPCRNAIIVGGKESLYSDSLIASKLTWSGCEFPTKPRQFMAKIRLPAIPVPVLVEPAGDGSVRVTFNEPQMSVTPGQLIAFYEEGFLMGGGIIDSAIAATQIKD